MHQIYNMRNDRDSSDVSSARGTFDTTETGRNKLWATATLFVLTKLHSQTDKLNLFFSLEYATGVGLFPCIYL